MNIKKLLVLSLLLSAGIFLKGQSAFAATKTWAGAGSDSNFNTSANWSPSGAPSNGDDLVFDTGTVVTRTEPVNNMAGLSVKSITFSGTGNGGVTRIKATTPLTVTESISDSSTVTAVTHVYGDIILGGDVTSRGVAYDEEGGSGSIDLNGNTLIFNDALGVNYIIAMTAPITGDGTVAFQADTNFQFEVANTYSGTTIYVMGSLITDNLLPSEVFGTSTINIGLMSEGLSLNLPDSANNTTWSNTISLSSDLQAVDSGYSSLFLRSDSGNVLNINIPNIVMNTNARLNSENVIVNLAGITANGHCIEYRNYSPTSDTWTGNGRFLNGPAYCVLASTTATKPKVPDTGFGLLMNNPAVTIGGTFAAAGAIIAISRRLKPATKRSRR